MASLNAKTAKVGPFGRVLNFFAKEKAVSVEEQPTEHRGSTGTTISAGYISEEYLEALVGRDARETYDKMGRSDGEIAMVLKGIMFPIRSATFKHEPGKGGDDRQKEIAAFLDWQWNENPLIDFDVWLAESLTMLRQGFSIHEKKYATIEHEDLGPVTVLGGLGFRKQLTIERWLVTSQGLSGVVQVAYGDTVDAKSGVFTEVTIPRENLIINVLDREGDNWEGVSLLRPCYGPWFRKNLYLKLMAIGIEKAAIGTPVGKFPRGVSKTDIDNFQNSLENFASHECSYIMTPDGYTIDFTKGEFDAQKIEAALRYEDQQMAKSALLQFLELGQNGGGGSYSLGEDQSSIAMNAIQFIGNMICKRMYEVDRDLVRWNFGEGVKVPWPRCTGIDPKAGEKLAKMLDVYTKNQIVRPDDTLEATVREQNNLPAAETKRSDAPLGSEPGIQPEGTTVDGKIKGAPAADAAGKVADVTLNGAQITAVVELMRAVAVGELPPDSARNLLTTAFPISDADAQKIMGKIGKGFKPKEPDKPEPPPGFPPKGPEKFSEPIPGDPEKPAAPSERWRELSIYERSLNLAEIEAQMTGETDSLARLMRGEMALFADKTARGVAALLRKYPNDWLKVIEEFRLDPGPYRKKLLGRLGAIVGVGSREVRDEMARKLGEVKFAEVDSVYIGNVEHLPPHVRAALQAGAKQAAQELTDRYAKIVARAIVKGMENKATDNEVLTLINEDAEDYQQSSSVDHTARLLTAQAYNRGRNGFMQENLTKLQAFQFSAVLDDKTTDICLSLDGKIFATDDGGLRKFTPPLHWGCRSILVPITVNEPAPEISGLFLDPQNPALIHQYKLRGLPPPTADKIRKSQNL